MPTTRIVDSWVDDLTFEIVYEKVCDLQTAGVAFIVSVINLLVVLVSQRETSDIHNGKNPT